MEVALKNVNEFRVDLSKFDDLVEEEGKQLKRKVAIAVLKGCIGRTAVDTGHCRGNWQVSFGSPSRTVVNAQDPAGQQTFMRGYTKLLEVELAPTIWVVNNVDYVSYLEHGTEKMAAQPMVAPTIAEVEARYDLLQDLPEGTTEL